MSAMGDKVVRLATFDEGPPLYKHLGINFMVLSVPITAFMSVKRVGLAKINSLGVPRAGKKCLGLPTPWVLPASSVKLELPRSPDLSAFSVAAISSIKVGHS